MRMLMRAWIVGVTLACAGGAVAAPTTPRSVYKAAAQLNDDGEYEQALRAIKEGLAMAPKELPLLGLKGAVLFTLRDYVGALAAYREYLDAGARGADARRAKKIIAILETAQATFLEITVANGPAVLYLDSRTQGELCTAAPSCSKVMLPGQYKVIAERAGFEPWSGRVTVAQAQTSKLAITLVERPSRLTVRVAQPAASVTVDGAGYDATTPLAAGRHQVVAKLAGYMEERREIVAREGHPVDLDLDLVPLVPIRLEPGNAQLELDAKIVAVVDGGLAVAPGAHRLVVRAPGFRDRRIELPAERPAEYQLEIRLEAEPVPAAVPVVASRFTPRRKLALAAGGVAVAAVAAGVVLGVQSGRLEDDALELCPLPTDCAAAARANQLNERGRTRALQANVGYGIASAAAIAATVLWFTGAPESRDAPGTRVSITPRLGAAAGVDVAVRF